ncbi:hypothetical protein LCGC14_1323520, partial [marine sediment metagenome]
MPITFQELRDSPEKLGQLRDLSQEAKGLVFDKLLPKEMSPEARQIVMNKILIEPAQDSRFNDLDAPPEWADVPLEALKNIPSSSIELGKNIYQAIRHPIETGKALGTV